MQYVFIKIKQLIKAIDMYYYITFLSNFKYSNIFLIFKLINFKHKFIKSNNYIRNLFLIYYIIFNYHIRTYLGDYKTRLKPTLNIFKNINYSLK